MRLDHIPKVKEEVVATIMNDINRGLEKIPYDQQFIQYMGEHNIALLHFYGKLLNEIGSEPFIDQDRAYKIMAAGVTMFVKAIDTQLEINELEKENEEPVVQNPDGN